VAVVAPVLKVILGVSEFHSGTVAVPPDCVETVEEDHSRSWRPAKARSDAYIAAVRKGQSAQAGQRPDLVDGANPATSLLMSNSRRLPSRSMAL